MLRWDRHESTNFIYRWESSFWPLCVGSGNYKEVIRWFASKEKQQHTNMLQNTQTYYYNHWTLLMQEALGGRGRKRRQLACTCLYSQCKPSKQGVAQIAAENLTQKGDDRDSNQAWVEPPPCILWQLLSARQTKAKIYSTFPSQTMISLISRICSEGSQLRDGKAPETATQFFSDATVRWKCPELPHTFSV